MTTMVLVCVYLKSKVLVFLFKLKLNNCCVLREGLVTFFCMQDDADEKYKLSAMWYRC